MKYVFHLSCCRKLLLFRYVDLKNPENETKTSNGIFFEHSRRTATLRDRETLPEDKNSMAVSVREANIGEALRSVDFYLLWIGIQTHGM